MDTSLQRENMEKPKNSHHPLKLGFKAGVAIFAIAIIGVTLLQFFLQFTLASHAIGTSDFWIQGFIISCILGSMLGIPLAIVVGLFVSGIAWFINRNTKAERGE